MKFYYLYTGVLSANKTSLARYVLTRETKLLHCVTEPYLEISWNRLKLAILTADLKHHPSPRDNARVTRLASKGGAKV